MKILIKKKNLRKIDFYIQLYWYTVIHVFSIYTLAKDMIIVKL